VQFFNKKQTFVFQTKEVGEKNSPYLCPLFGFVNYYPYGRKYKQPSKEDRIKIRTLLSCNKTQKEIVQEFKVHPSIISLLN